MSLTITGARSELGRLLAAHDTRANVHINVAGQQANTLLHDGHAWKDFNRTAVAGARRAARADASMLVHASFAFVVTEPAHDPLRSLAQTIHECESIVLAAAIPACVVRLGYLYGPTSRDLRAYRSAFQLGRPYWAGPRDTLQYHLHSDDAISALLAAAKTRHAGKTFYATDGTPVAFMQFMDDFARKWGRRRPLHVPRIAAPLMRLVVRKEHVQQCDHIVPARAPKPSVPGWKPVHADYRLCQDEIIAQWGARPRARSTSA